jgi:hypothetical protein
MLDRMRSMPEVSWTSYLNTLAYISGIDYLSATSYGTLDRRCKLTSPSMFFRSGKFIQHETKSDHHKDSFDRMNVFQLFY